MCLDKDLELTYYLSIFFHGGPSGGCKKLSKSQQQNRREIRMAYLTFIIVTLFFVLHMPRILCAAYEVSNTWKIVR